MSGIAQIPFDEFKLIDLGQAATYKLYQSLFEDHAEPVGCMSIVQAFGQLQPSDQAIQSFRTKWEKGAGRRVMGTLELVTGKSSTREMASTPHGEVAVLVMSFLIEALGAETTCDLVYRVISTTPDHLLSIRPTKGQITGVILAIQSQTENISWHNEIHAALACVHEEPFSWDTTISTPGASPNIPIKAIGDFYQALCAVSRFPNDHRCIIRSTCSLSLPFVLAHSICGLKVCIIIDGVVVYGHPPLEQWQVKLERLPGGAGNFDTAVELVREHKLEDAERLMQTNDPETPRRDWNTGEGNAGAAGIARTQSNILCWLTEFEYGPTQKTYLETRELGTGQWLLESEEFQDWLAQPSGTLFCPGMPGVGKTILTSIVVDELELRARNDPTTGLAYIYFSFQRQEEQSLYNLLASILKQLAQRHPSLLRRVNELYDQHMAGQTRPSLNEIIGLLHLGVALYSRVFVVADALDESSSSGSCRTRFLSDIFDLQSRHGINIFATSRPIPEIADHFVTAVILEIRASNSDIATYIKRNVQQMPSIVQRDRQLQEEISARITESVDGRFLLARLCLGALHDGMTRRNIRDTMATFQSRNVDLSRAYEDTMQSIHAQEPRLRELAIGALSQLMLANRQLTPSQLQGALATTASASQLGREALPLIDDIITACRGLVKVDITGRIISLFHYSAQDYLMQTRERWFPSTPHRAAYRNNLGISRASDSGYVSETPKTQKNVFLQPPDPISEEKGDNPNADEHSTWGDVRSESGSGMTLGTEYSLASSALPGRVDRYISELALLLVRAMPLDRADDRTFQTLIKELPDMLKTFALMISHCGSTPAHQETMFFAYKHRRDIVDQFRICYNDIEEESRSLIGRAEPLSKRDIIDRFFDQMEPDVSPILAIQPPEADAGAGEDADGQSSEVSDDLTDADLPETSMYRECIVASAAYGWLKDALYTETTQTTAFPNIRKGIQDKVTRSLRALRAAQGFQKVSRSKPIAASRAVFEMNWDPLSFVKQQGYHGAPEDVIRMAITLTGSDQECQAMTTSQYLSQTWPTVGSRMMRLIEQVMSAQLGLCQSATWPDRTTVTACFTQRTFVVTALGPGPTLAEIAAQLAWLGAALRRAPREYGVWFCTPYIKSSSIGNELNSTPGNIATAECRFQIGFDFDQHVVDNHSNGQCWHGMFRSPVIVRGYPVARRPCNQVGLEMPLNMMAHMVKTRHAVPLGSTWYLKGFSSMLTLATQRGDFLLWHHNYKRDGDHISYFDRNATNPVTIEASELQRARHIVGWCPDVKLFAGMCKPFISITHSKVTSGAADDVNYNVGSSELDRPHATCVLDKVSISGGKFVSGGASIALGVRDSPLHLSKDTYFDKMRWISEQYVILWDEGDNRGWLINGASALLHLVRATLDDSLQWMKKYADESEILFKKEHLEDPSSAHASSSALKVLMSARNRELRIFVNDVDEWEDREKDEPQAKTTYTRFKHLVESQFRLMEQAMNRQFHIEDRSGLDLKWRVRKYLEGWDFRDMTVTAKTQPIYARVKYLPTIARGWVDLTREIKAVTIFGKSFGDVIRPSDATSMCARWAQVPAGHYFLTACVSDLKTIVGLKDDECTCRSPINICGGLQWHVTERLFQGCACNRAPTDHVKHSDDPVQVLTPSRMVFGKQPNTGGIVELGRNGAVIFGYSSGFSLQWPELGNPREERVLTNTLEAVNDFHDSGIGTSPVPTNSNASTGSPLTAAPDQATTAACPAPPHDAAPQGVGPPPAFMGRSAALLPQDQLGQGKPSPHTSGNRTDVPALGQGHRHGMLENRFDKLTTDLASERLESTIASEQSPIEAVTETPAKLNTQRERLRRRIKSLFTMVQGQRYGK